MVDLRSLFFGSRVRVVATVLGLLVALVGGAVATGVIGTPTVESVDNRFGPVNASTTVIESDIVVETPDLELDLGGTTVSYTVAMNDIEMAYGEKRGLAIEESPTVLHFRTLMDNEQIPAWWVSHIENDEQTTLVIDAEAHSTLIGQSISFPIERQIETDVISQFNSKESRPVNADQPVVSDPVLYINETSASWGEVSEAETPIPMEFVVYNPKPAPYTITEVGYEITMNDVQVGSGATTEPHVIPPGGTETIATTAAIQNRRLDDWWVTHLKRDQVTDLRIDFYAIVELPTGNTIRVPLDEMTYTKEIETDFFGTRNGTDAGSGGGSNDGSSDATPTSSSGSETTTTADSTATTPATTTSTTTSTTDDGLLDTDTTTTTSDTTTQGTTTTTTTEDDGLLAVRWPLG